MLKWYVAPKAAVAPLNIDSTTTATGTIIKKLNPSKISQFPNVYDENIPAIQTRYTVGDVQAAEQEEAKSQNLAIYNTFYRVNPASNPGELLLASQARYAFNRNTSQLVNCCGPTRTTRRSTSPASCPEVPVQPAAVDRSGLGRHPADDAAVRVRRHQGCAGHARRRVQERDAAYAGPR